MGTQERVRQFIECKGLTVQKFEQACGLSNGSVKRMGNYTRTETLDKIANVFPDFDVDWIRTGKKPAETIPGAIPYFDDEIFTGGYLQGTGEPLLNKVDDVKLPFLKVRDGDFAVQVHGRSMIDTERPELSINDGAIVCLRPWTLEHIEWGERYAVATSMGYSVKYIVPSDKEDYIKCVPANKGENFAPYYINVHDVIAIARVTAIINLQIL